MTTKKRTKKQSPNIDKEALGHWKKTSIKARLEWLDAALRFGKNKSF